MLGVMVWAIPSKICENFANNSTSDRDVRATMKIAFGMWVFPLWAFLMSSLFTYLFADYFSHSSKTILCIVWVAFLILTPMFLVLSLIFAESMNFFPGFLRLAKLRFFFSRAWLELIKEWREVSEGVLSKIKPNDN